MELYILVDNVRSLYNVGSIFRSAEATGVSKIFLGGYSGTAKLGNTVDLHPKLKKTALEGIDVPWEYCPNSLEKITQLKQAGITVLSLEQTRQSLEYTQVVYTLPLCIIVGHEREGIEEDILNQSDMVVQIPMAGQGKSLNVSVATGILLYEIKRQIASN